MTDRGLARRTLPALLVAALLLAACHRPAGDPVERTLNAIAAAARERDADAVLSRLASGFTGTGGLSLQETGVELRRYFALYDSVEVGIADLEIERPEPGIARARFRVSLSGKPKAIGGLAGMLPDVERLRFEATLAEREDWRLTAATWERLASTP